MDNLAPISTQRSLSVRSAASSRNATLVALWRTYNAQPAQLQRTREGRSLSRERYRRADEFMPSLAPKRRATGQTFYTLPASSLNSPCHRICSISAFPTPGALVISASTSTDRLPMPMPAASATSAPRPHGWRWCFHPTGNGITAIWSTARTRRTAASRPTRFGRCCARSWTMWAMSQDTPDRVAE